MLILLLVLSEIQLFSHTLATRFEFCNGLKCDLDEDSPVCGIKEEQDGVRLKMFKNECEFLMHGCSVDEAEAYGKMDIEYCDETFSEQINEVINVKENDENKTKDEKKLNHEQIDDLLTKYCDSIKCDVDDTGKVCGIRLDGEGFRVAKFRDRCAMAKLNCINNVNFTATEHIFCHGLEENNDKDIPEIAADKQNKRPKNIIVIKVSGATFRNNITNTINDFFAATHVIKFPIQKIPLEEQIKNITRRNMLVKNAGPVVVFKPWIVIPKNVSDEDTMYQPTLSSCFHRCPEVCPDTYTPVCGAPGTNAREPSLMFQNHCFMDMAQCKMRWENKSPTSEMSSYIESSFMFCIGDQMNSLLRFLPLLRTLQHMGRLKRKGKFKYKLRNLRFLNNYMFREPKLMG